MGIISKVKTCFFVGLMLGALCIGFLASPFIGIIILVCVLASYEDEIIKQETKEETKTNT
jgi:hypothetical protein